MANRQTHILKGFAIVVLTIILPLYGFAQRNLDKGTRLFDLNQYEEAIPYFEREIKQSKGKIRKQATEKLADCYRLLGNFEEAEKVYKKLISRGGGAEAVFKYGQALKAAAKYAEAKEEFLRYAQLKPDDPRGLMFAESCELAQYWLDADPDYEVRELKHMNTVYPEISPTYYKSGIVFSSSRPGGVKPFLNFEGGNSEVMLDMYYIKMDGTDKTENEIAAFFPDLNTEMHEGPLCFSEDGRKMYFTRTIASAKKKKKGKSKSKSKEGANVIQHTLQIFVTRLDSNNKWTLPESAIPYNSKKYSVAHPTLSPDGRKLYFVSDMPGGYGGTDIYVCYLNTDGTWSEPMNLGPDVNTFGFELYPFLYEEGILHFSSSGHPGMGKLDIFECRFDSLEGWTHVTNMKPPINSIGDDICYVSDPSGNRGFLVSNRINGTGDDDVYVFNKLAPTLIEFDGLYFRVKDNSLYDGVKAKIKPKGEKSSVEIPSNKGYFEFMPEVDKSYKFYLRKDGFLKNRFDIKVELERGMPVVHIKASKDKFIYKGYIGEYDSTYLAEYLPKPEPVVMDTLVADSVVTDSIAAVDVQPKKEKVKKEKAPKEKKVKEGKEGKEEKKKDADKGESSAEAALAEREKNIHKPPLGKTSMEEIWNTNSFRFEHHRMPYEKINAFRKDSDSKMKRAKTDQKGEFFFELAKKEKYKIYTEKVPEGYTPLMPQEEPEILVSNDIEEDVNIEIWIEDDTTITGKLILKHIEGQLLAKSLTHIKEDGADFMDMHSNDSAEIFVTLHKDKMYSFSVEDDGKKSLEKTISPFDLLKRDEHVLVFEFIEPVAQDTSEENYGIIYEHVRLLAEEEQELFGIGQEEVTTELQALTHADSLKQTLFVVFSERGVVPDADITITFGDEEVTSLSTDEKGKAVSWLEFEKIYKVTVVAEKHDTLSEEFIPKDFWVEAQNISEIALPISRDKNLIEIAGIVNSDGSSLSEVTVTVMKDGARVADAVSDSTGKFKVELLKGQEYEFAFAKNGYESGIMAFNSDSTQASEEGIFELSMNMMEEVEIVISDSTWLQLIVREGDDPLAGANVDILQNGNSVMTGQTDEKGTHYFEHKKSAKYTYSVSMDGYLTMEEEIVPEELMQGDSAVLIFNMQKDFRKEEPEVEEPVVEESVVEETTEEEIPEWEEITIELDGPEDIEQLSLGELTNFDLTEERIAKLFAELNLKENEIKTLGLVFSGDLVLKDADVEIYEVESNGDDSLVTTLKSDDFGLFVTGLSARKIYTIAVSREGFSSYRKTFIPERILREGKERIDLRIELSGDMASEEFGDDENWLDGLTIELDGPDDIEQLSIGELNNFDLTEERLVEMFAKLNLKEDEIKTLGLVFSGDLVLKDADVEIYQVSPDGNDSLVRTLKTDDFGLFVTGLSERKIYTVSVSREGFSSYRKTFIPGRILREGRDRIDLRIELSGDMASDDFADDENWLDGITIELDGPDDIEQLSIGELQNFDLTEERLQEMFSKIEIKENEIKTMGLVFSGDLVIKDAEVEIFEITKDEDKLVKTMTTDDFGLFLTGLQARRVYSVVVAKEGMSTYRKTFVPERILREGKERIELRIELSNSLAAGEMGDDEYWLDGVMIELDGPDDIQQLDLGDFDNFDLTEERLAKLFSELTLAENEIKTMGLVHSGDLVIRDATISIYEGMDELKKTMKSDQFGLFVTGLDAKKVYTVEVAKSGYSTYRRTFIPERILRPGKERIELKVELDNNLMEMAGDEDGEYWLDGVTIELDGPDEVDQLNIGELDSFNLTEERIKSLFSNMTIPDDHLKVLGIVFSGYQPLDGAKVEVFLGVDSLIATFDTDTSGVWATTMKREWVHTVKVTKPEYGTYFRTFRPMEILQEGKDRIELRIELEDLNPDREATVDIGEWNAPIGQSDIGGGTSLSSSDIDARLEALTAGEGQVKTLGIVKSNNGPVDATVRIFEGDQMVHELLADESGIFTVVLELDMIYRFETEKEGYTSEPENISMKEAFNPEKKRAVVRLSMEAPEEEEDYAFDTSQEVEGTSEVEETLPGEKIMMSGEVTSENAPIEGVDVQFYKEDELIGQAFTDASGAYTVELEAGQYDVLAMHDAYKTFEEPLKVDKSLVPEGLDLAKYNFEMEARFAKSVDVDIEWADYEFTKMIEQLDLQDKLDWGLSEERIKGLFEGMSMEDEDVKTLGIVYSGQRAVLASIKVFEEKSLVGVIKSDEAGVFATVLNAYKPYTLVVKGDGYKEKRMTIMPVNLINKETWRVELKIEVEPEEKTGMDSTDIVNREGGMIDLANPTAAMDDLIKDKLDLIKAAPGEVKVLGIISSQGEPIQTKVIIYKGSQIAKYVHSDESGIFATALNMSDEYTLFAEKEGYETWRDDFTPAENLRPEKNRAELRIEMEKIEEDNPDEWVVDPNSEDTPDGKVAQASPFAGDLSLTEQKLISEKLAELEPKENEVRVLGILAGSDGSPLEGKAKFYVSRVLKKEGESDESGIFATVLDPSIEYTLIAVAEGYADYEGTFTPGDNMNNAKGRAELKITLEKLTLPEVAAEPEPETPESKMGDIAQADLGGLNESLIDFKLKNLQVEQGELKTLGLVFAAGDPVVAKVKFFQGTTLAKSATSDKSGVFVTALKAGQNYVAEVERDGYELYSYKFVPDEFYNEAKERVELRIELIPEEVIVEEDLNLPELSPEVEQLSLFDRNDFGLTEEMLKAQFNNLEVTNEQVKTLGLVYSVDDAVEEANVQVYIGDELIKATRSDEAGVFALALNANDHYTVKVTKDGYSTWERTFIPIQTLLPGKDRLELRVELENLNPQEEVAVQEETRTPVEQADIGPETGSLEARLAAIEVNESEVRLLGIVSAGDQPISTQVEFYRGTARIKGEFSDNTGVFISKVKKDSEYILKIKVGGYEPYEQKFIAAANMNVEKDRAEVRIQLTPLEKAETVVDTATPTEEETKDSLATAEPSVTDPVAQDASENITQQEVADTATHDSLATAEPVVTDPSAQDAPENVTQQDTTENIVQEETAETGSSDSLATAEPNVTEPTETDPLAQDAPENVTQQESEAEPVKAEMNYPKDIIAQLSLADKTKFRITDEMLASKLSTIQAPADFIRTVGLVFCEGAPLVADVQFRDETGALISELRTDETGVFATALPPNKRVTVDVSKEGYSSYKKSFTPANIVKPDLNRIELKFELFDLRPDAEPIAETEPETDAEPELTSDSADVAEEEIIDPTAQDAPENVHIEETPVDSTLADGDTTEVKDNKATTWGTGEYYELSDEVQLLNAGDKEQFNIANEDILNRLLAVEAAAGEIRVYGLVFSGEQTISTEVKIYEGDQLKETIISDESGVFVTSLKANQIHTIKVDPDGYSNYKKTFVPFYLLKDGEERIELRIDLENEHPEINPYEVLTIGKVLGRDESLVGAEVIIYEEGEAYKQFLTDSLGYFETALQKDKVYTAAIRKEGFRDFQQSFIPVKMTSTNELKLEFNMSKEAKIEDGKFYLVGNVTHFGQPLSRAKIVIFEDGDDYASMRTDENGYYEIKIMDDVPYTVVATKESFTSQQQSVMPGSGNEEGKVKLDFQLKLRDLVPFEGMVSHHGMPVPNANVQVYKGNDLILETTTNKRGKYVINVLEGDEYSVAVTKPGYFQANIDMNLQDGYDEMAIDLDVELEEVEEDKPVVLSNVYYEYGSARLDAEATARLDQLITFLKLNPDIRKIEIGAHTDSRGSADFNYNLSQARAVSVVEYLVMRGIDPSRLSPRGYGESVPALPGALTEEQHLLNRRTEVKVLEVD